VQELEADLIERLRVYVRTPQVVVTVVQFRSEPVFFVGAFQRPGIYPLLGRRTLIEMLASIGGLLPNASRRIKVTRRAEVGEIPLENAIKDPVTGVSTVEISMDSLRENVNPAEDIVLQPYDVIAVERAELVYVNGALARVGAFELGERDSISVAQVLSLAGGLAPNADAKKARVLRPILDTSRRAEISLDLTKVLTGEVNDFPLRPNDVLYVPAKNSRVDWSRIGWLAAGALPTLLVFAFR
jgi:polysaccharide export outer membrane protein